MSLNFAGSLALGPAMSKSPPFRPLRCTVTSPRATDTAPRLRLGLAWTDLDLVITNAVGEPVRPSTASAQFRAVAQSLSFDRLRFHDTRHTHATILLKTGVPPHVVSKRLGHASVAFTLQIYSWVLPGQQREAAEGFAAAVSAK